jgi:hypothetical protein
LKSRGLQGVKLVISDAHTGLKAAIARVFEATTTAELFVVDWVAMEGFAGLCHGCDG